MKNLMAYKTGQLFFIAGYPVIANLYLRKAYGIKK